MNKRHKSVNMATQTEGGSSSFHACSDRLRVLPKGRDTPRAAVHCADHAGSPTLVNVVSQIQGSSTSGSRPHLGLPEVVDADLFGLQEVEQVLPLPLGDVAEQVVLRTITMSGLDGVAKQGLG